MHLIGKKLLILGKKSMLGRKLRLLREQHNYSRDKVYTEIGVSDRTYAKYENNEEYPKHSIIVAIAKLYNIEPSELEYSEPKMLFENKDNTKINNQGTINVSVDLNDLKASWENTFKTMQDEIEYLKKENKQLMQLVMQLKKK